MTERPGFAGVPCLCGVPELVEQRHRIQVKRGVEAAKAALIGKRFAFEGCVFASQGSFATVGRPSAMSRA